LELRGVAIHVGCVHGSAILGVTIPIIKNNNDATIGIIMLPLATARRSLFQLVVTLIVVSAKNQPQEWLMDYH
jgi:hypothetical protein